MNARSSATNLEPRWETYLKAVVFLLPALVLWELVCVKCVPILVNICQNAGPIAGSAKGFWQFSMFLVQYGFTILAALLVVFVLLESFSLKWAHYRRRAVSGAVWLLNSIVICGLAALFTLTLIVFPNLLK